MKGKLTGRPAQHPGALTADHVPVAPAQSLLHKLLGSSIVLAEDWEALPPDEREALLRCAGEEALLRGLVENKILTAYQADRVEAGKTFGLILGNYRVLDRIGAGGMGVVFKAENLDIRRVVAVKVLPLHPDQDPRMLRRFVTEMRAVSRLQHPNIVAAIDGGTAASPDGEGPALRYFVMEFVAGQDLEEHVGAHGPLSPAQACDVIYQVASALAEAHKHHLVHRDIKPSNVRLTPEGQAKLLDFGLARDFRNRFTEPGTVLGTVDYMAPEQARDAGSVDIRADIYGLGGTLFWCLTGQPPFPPKESLIQQLTSRLTQPPPSARARRPDVPPELDAVVSRMMAVNPEERYPTPEAVMRAMLPFLKPDLREHLAVPGARAVSGGDLTTADGRAGSTPPHRILLVDDEATIRQFCRFALEGEEFCCEEASGGAQALEALRGGRFDLVLLDVDMPGMSGPEVCRRLREDPPSAHLKVIMVSGRASPDEMAQIMLAGADDYLTKPPGALQLQARVKAALRLKEAQDRSDVLNRHLQAVNRELEQSLSGRDSDLVQTRNALVLALAKLVESRNSETGAHLVRMQRYARCLVEEAALAPAFSGQIDRGFIDMVECCAPLHDIGKVALPDHILLKPGKLEPEERLLMQTHTTVGAETLRAVAEQHGSAVGFLQTAMDIARHHHERYDGQGYPDRLAGDAIPLAARVVAVADVYDALRSRRSYKPALSHAAALLVMIETCAGQFDPALLHAFQRCAPLFERIYRELAD